MTTTKRARAPSTTNFEDLPWDLRFSILYASSANFQLSQALRSLFPTQNPIMVIQGYRPCGLFFSNRTYWACSYVLQPALHPPPTLFTILDFLAEHLHGAFYNKNERKSWRGPSKEYILQEYTGGSLRGTRCVRLFEYAAIDCFDFEHFKIDSHGDCFADSTQAEEFLKRWQQAFDVELDPVFGFMNELSEHDLSKNW